MGEAINRKVLDISHHNTVQSWDAVRNAGVVGIIHKATQGTGYVDPTYLERARGALNAGLLWGAYHFGDGSSAKAQVDNFLKVVGVDDETLYSLDWEENPNGADMTEAIAREFVERLEDKIGINNCVIYSGNTAKEVIKGCDPFWGAHRLWLAQYGTSPSCQASWDSYWLWQYSDGQSGPEPHGCPGVSGYVDTNSWPYRDVDLRAEWAGARIVPPKPSPDEVATVDIVTTGEVRICVNGQLIE